MWRHWGRAAKIHHPNKVRFGILHISLLFSALNEWWSEQSALNTSFKLSWSSSLCGRGRIFGLCRFRELVCRLIYGEKRLYTRGGWRNADDDADDDDL